MSVSEDKTNPYHPPLQAVERRLVSTSGLTVSFFACIAMALAGFVLSGNAIFWILKTTPAMGISVDVNGNPIPIQGYTQLGFGLAGMFIFTLFAVGLSHYRARRRWASHR